MDEHLLKLLKNLRTKIKLVIDDAEGSNLENVVKRGNF